MHSPRTSHTLHIQRSRSCGEIFRPYSPSCDGFCHRFLIASILASSHDDTLHRQAIVGRTASVNRRVFLGCSTSPSASKSIHFCHPYDFNLKPPLIIPPSSPRQQTLTHLQYQQILHLHLAFLHSLHSTNTLRHIGDHAHFSLVWDIVVNSSSPPHDLR